MEMPLFPLNVVLFPGMVLPLHVFEPRYREMINHCIEEEKPFGVVLIDEGQEVGGPAAPRLVGTAAPRLVGTAARITRVDRLDGGRMNITTVGTRRFRIMELDSSRAYLTAKVRQYPVANGSTRLAEHLARDLRPKVLEYVELLSEASKTELRLDRLPEDATTLALLVAIALQVDNEEKQALLEMSHVPEMLARERYLLSLETALLRHMVETQADVQEMGGGPTGYVFPN
jgi:Lon protease-like protein